MPNSVDDRVVRMEFQNQNFERNAAQSMSTLSALEKSLQLKNAGAGLKDIEATSKGLHLQDAIRGVEGLSAKFLALSTIGITVLSNLTNRAVDAGLRITKSLTLEGITAGFHEYEQGIGSIQTILANTSRFGTSLQDVTKSLDELNNYADKTIFSFGDMTKNIGLFTNAGIKVEDATSMIQGFSNVAAASGTNAEQAAGAAYQLSQALSAGTIRLMDWRSLTNANMGNKNMQQGLIDIAGAMGTLSKSGVTAKDIQSNFNASLEKGWLSADVMSKFLNIMAGSMTDAQMKTLGLNDAQIKTFHDQQKMAEEAATKVRTFTQLIGTTKEAIGSGWSETFRTVVGNFEEATSLWSGLNKVVSGFVGRNAAVRNMTLEGAKQGGAFLLIIDGLRKGFTALMSVLRPIGQAFREVFPRKTAQDIVNMSRTFNQFMSRLQPSAATITNLKYAFKGFFSALSIGWTVVKEGIKFIADLVKTILGLGGVGSGKYLTFFTNLGQSVTDLKKKLVDAGGIHKFFQDISGAIDRALPSIQKVKTAIFDFFAGIFGKGSNLDKVGDSVGRFGSRFEHLKGLLGKLGNIFDPLFSAMGGVGKKLDKVFTVIRDWFKQLGKKIADTMGKGDWNAVLDAVNLGLLTAIAGLIAKFMKNGIQIDPTGGMFDSIKKAFGGLTDQLSAMQTKVKAEALQKIAIAVGILTASVVALSLIDSAALTKAMTAMAVGFGQLLGAFKVIDAMTGDARSAAKFASVAAGMNLLATSMVTLSLAVAILAQLSWEDMMKGLGGVTTLLVVLTLVAGPLSDAGFGMISAGIGITALAVGLTILAGAVKLFSMMSWGDLAKGLVAIAAALVLIGVSMNLMPATLPLTAAGLIGVAVAMNILAGAMKIFATMSWEDLGKGAAALAGGLVLIAAGMNLMPVTLPITAAGLLIVANALVIMAGAMKLFGTMDWGEIGRSLTVLAGSLLILALALNAMSGAVGGAAALLVASVALAAFQKVLQTFADMSWGDILHGLGAIALALLGLGATATVLSIFVPALIALGVAISVLSTGFLIFGAAALLTAKAFKIFADTGEKGAKSFLSVMQAVGQAMPTVWKGLAKGVIEFATTLAAGFPPLLKIIGAFVGQILDTIIKLIPKFVQAGLQMLEAFVLMAYTQGPVFIALGLFLLTTLLQGIQDNIAQISQKVLTIVGTFLMVLQANAGNLSNAGFGVLLAFLKGVEDNIGRVVDKGADIIVKIIEGIGRNAGKLTTTAINTIIKFADELGKNMDRLIDKGFELIGKFLEGIGKRGKDLTDAAFDAVIKFVNGVADSINEHSEELRKSGERLAFAIVNGMTGGLASRAKEVADKAGEVAKGALDKAWSIVKPGSPSKVTTDMGQKMGDGFVKGLGQREDDVVRAAENIVDGAFHTFNSHIRLMADSLESMDDFSPSITPVLDLSKVKADASLIGDYIQAQKINASVSLDSARAIAAASAPRDDTPSTPDSSQAPTFQQIINAPKQLSTGDIYKNTRNQITLAKKELSIP